MAEPVVIDLCEALARRWMLRSLGHGFAVSEAVLDRGRLVGGRFRTFVDPQHAQRPPTRLKAGGAVVGGGADRLLALVLGECAEDRPATLVIDVSRTLIVPIFQHAEVTAMFS